MQNNKELFIKAFLEAEEISNARGMQAADAVTFSNAFEKRMNKLLEKEKSMRLSTGRTIRNSLVAAAIAILVLLTGLMSVAATREPIVEFVKRVFPQFNEITLDETSCPPISMIETEYTITNLPKGYVLDTYWRGELSVQSVWKNESGEKIYFRQNTLDSNYSVDTECTYEELYVNGYRAYYYTTGIVWTDGVYWFSLDATKGNKDMLIELSKNILEKN